MSYSDLPFTIPLYEQIKGSFDLLYFKTFRAIISFLSLKFKQMTLDNFEQTVEPKIVERGFGYFQSGEVVRLEKVGENEFSALVVGTQKYDVFVKLNGRGIVEYECTCPYDYGDTCKHAVAVFYKLRKNDFTDSAEKLGGLLDNMHNDALRRFVNGLLKKDRKFRQEFLRTFDEDFEEDEDDEFFDEDYY